MTQLLLDTTFLIDAERDVALLDGLIGDDDEVAIAAITVAELRVCVQLATARQRPRRQSFLAGIVAIAHADLLVAVRSAGRPRGAHDLIIAATAVSAGRTVVSADRRAFDDLAGILSVDHRSA